MEYYWKSIALIIIGVVLWIVVGKLEKDYAVLITVGLCCITASVAAAYLKPVIELLKEMNEIAAGDNSALRYLLTAAGTGFVSEITARVCADAGNSSAGAMARLLGSSVMLYCGIPVMQSLTVLIQEILGVI